MWLKLLFEWLLTLTLWYTLYYKRAQNTKCIFEKLSYGGCVTLQPVEAFYSTFHAALTDKFGVNWNIVAEEAPNNP